MIERRVILVGGGQPTRVGKSTTFLAEQHEERRFMVKWPEPVCKPKPHHAKKSRRFSGYGN